MGDKIQNVQQNSKWQTKNENDRYVKNDADSHLNQVKYPSIAQPESICIAAVQTHFMMLYSITGLYYLIVVIPTLTVYNPNNFVRK